MGLVSDLEKKKVRLTVNITGLTHVIHGRLEKYSKPFLQVKTREGVRIFNEHAVREIVPMKGD